MLNFYASVCKNVIASLIKSYDSYWVFSFMDIFSYIRNQYIRVVESLNHRLID